MIPNSFPFGYQSTTVPNNTATLIPIIQSQNQISIVNNPVNQLIQLQMPTSNSYNNMQIHTNNLNNMHLSNQQSTFASNIPNMFITTAMTVVPVRSDLSNIVFPSQPSIPTNKTIIPDINSTQQSISPSSVISTKSNKIHSNAFKSPSPPPPISNSQAPLPPPLNRNNPFSTSLNEKYMSAMRMRLPDISNQKNTVRTSSSDVRHLLTTSNHCNHNQAQQRSYNGSSDQSVTLSLDELLNLWNSLTETEKTQLQTKPQQNQTEKQYKPYSCKYCNKSFNFKKDCAKHQIVHGGNCPYHCYCCNKSFASKSRLHTHQQAHNMINIKR